MSADRQQRRLWPSLQLLQRPEALLRSRQRLLRPQAAAQPAAVSVSTSTVVKVSTSSQRESVGVLGTEPPASLSGFATTSKCNDATAPTR